MVKKGRQAIKLNKETIVKEVVNKVWPKTKKELERSIKNAKILIDKGEKHLKSFSDSSARQAKKLSLNLKKEQLYYRLGKTLSKLTKSKWGTDENVAAILKQIKDIDSSIRKL